MIQNQKIEAQKVQPDGRPFPLVKMPEDPAIKRETFNAWLTENHTHLKDELEQFGAILFRGFPIEEPAHFEAILDAAQFENMPYVGGAAPREQVTRSRILTANEAPPEKPIPFHHEMAQVPNPPNYIFFCCDTPSQTGGETAIVHSHTVYQRFQEIDPVYAETIEDVGVKYRRIMPDYDDPNSPIGRSWRSTFQTDDRDTAETRMRAAGMEWHWRANGDLETITGRLPAIRTDKRSGRKTFFNAVVAAYTGWIDERNDPERAVMLADGQPLKANVVHQIAQAMHTEAVAFRWHRGDVLMIDNQLVLHSRRPFTGKRRILASIAQS